MLIQFDNITYAYDTHVALQDLSLSLTEGEVLIIQGPSGSGKTTLLQILGKLIVPQQGTYVFDAGLIDRQKQFGYAFIDGPFFEDMSVRENILFLQTFAGVLVDMQYYTELLTYFEMQSFENIHCRKLSVGQRERVGIIRAFIHRPKICILDEPGSNLDEKLFARLFSFLQKIKKAGHTALCIATHDNRYMDLADQNISVLLHDA